MQSPASKRWSAILDEAARSELSMRNFAHAHGLNPNTLAWWKWKLARDEAPSSPFLEVALSVPSPALRVHVGGAHIDVHDEVNLELLRQVVEVLA